MNQLVTHGNWPLYNLLKRKSDFLALLNISLQSCYNNKMRIGNMFKDTIHKGSRREADSPVKARKKSIPKKRAAEASVKVSLSASQIRAKVEKLKNPKDEKTVIEPIIESPKIEQLDNIEEVGNSEEKVIIGDIKDNSPQDPLVREKLRAIMKSGAFSFNDKTQNILSGILGESED